MKKFYTLCIIGSAIGALVFIILGIVNKDGYSVYVSLFSVIIIPLFVFLRKRQESKETQQHHVLKLTTSPIFNVTINKAFVINDSDGSLYRFQIEVSLNAVGRSVCIQSISLFNNDYSFTNQFIPIKSFFVPDDTDYLRLPCNEYCKEISLLCKTPIKGLVIRDDAWCYLLLTDIVKGTRLPDGYEDFNINDWKMTITYNDGQEKIIPFCFSIHTYSQKIPTSYRYTGFNE